MTTEIRTLSLHPLAIHTFIKAQAGSLAKALSEAVMNSLDAFATTVDVTIDGTGFVVSDDGKGFANKEQIAGWFETLGFPHDEGNHRIWGYFGMGRAQAWSYARTTWRSNQFEMRVDVKKSGLDYELRELPDREPGTRIDGTFYAPLTISDVERTKRELAGLLRYVPGLVTVNGQVVNKDPSTEQWPLETEDAWFDVKETTSGSDGLTVYNAGVLVRSYPYWQFRVSGTIVTKPGATLSLNIARNEILEAECPVWKRIRAKLASMYRADPPKKATRKKATPQQMATEAAHLKAGTKSLEDVLKACPDMLVTVLGRPFGLGDFRMGWSTLPVVFVPKGDDVGKRLSKTRSATVLAKESLTLLGFESPQELKDVLIARARKAGRNSYWRTRPETLFEERIFTDNPREHFPEVYAGRVTLATSELSDPEKAALRAWSTSWSVIRGALAEVAPTEEIAKELRRSFVVAGDAAEGQIWRDRNVIVFRRQELALSLTRRLGTLSKYAMSRVRDVCRLVCADEAQGDAIFMKALCETSLVGVGLPSLLRHYIHYLNEYKLPVTDAVLENLDSVEPPAVEALAA